jgi:hypothetical protein
MVMKKLTAWLDGLAARACNWLNAFLPGDHPLAVAGYGLAGVTPGLLLPVDRRLVPTRHYMANAWGGPADAVHGNPRHTPGVWPFRLDPHATETKCSFWAYCHVSGVPCEFCKPAGAGPINSLDDADHDLTTEIRAKCPRMSRGLQGDYAWWGCCKDPNTGRAKYLAFADCCSPSGHVKDCAGLTKSGHPDQSKWCEAWPEAKNWCYGGGDQQGTYYCTFVVYIKSQDGQC